MLFGLIGVAVTGFGFVILLADASLAARTPSNHISLENDIYPWLLLPIGFFVITVAGALIAWLDQREEE